MTARAEAAPPCRTRSWIRRCSRASVQTVWHHPRRRIAPASWSGDWTGDRARKTDAACYCSTGTAAVTGTINPGPNAVPIAAATLDPETWAVRIEAEGRDADDNAVAYVIDGELQNIGSYNRVITGTWTQGGTSGDFTVMRN